MNNCCCAELTVDVDQQIDLTTESDSGVDVGVAEQFVIGGGGNYQDKTVNITPTESAQSQTVQADVGYDALDEVEVNVAAVSDTYVGSAVPRKSSANVAINGAKFTAPAGYYASDAEKTMPTAGWDITATKGAVSNHSVSVTPKAEVFYGGYAQETVRTGTAVSVSASELDSGTKSITSNGNAQDVVGYAAVNVSVPNSYTSADEGKVVSSGALVSQTSDTVTQNGTVDTTLINSLTVNVSGGGGYTPDEIATSGTGSGVLNITVSSIRGHAFYDWTGLTGINAPNVTSVGTNALRGCTGMASIYLPQMTTFSSGAFAAGTAILVFPALTSLESRRLEGWNGTTIDLGDMRNGFKATSVYGCPNVNVIVLRRSTAVSLAGTNAFNNSPFASGKAGGTLYVPNDLISTYQSASNWSTILGYATNQIKSIESTHTDPTAPIDLTLYYADGTPIPT